MLIMDSDIDDDNSSLSSSESDEEDFLSSEDPSEESFVSWDVPIADFNSRFDQEESCNDAEITNSLNEGSDELSIFLRLFPRSLLIHIADCTNQRIKMQKKNFTPTDQYELMMILGCMLIMSYNHLPEIIDYWSSNESLGNQMIKKTISRHRGTTILSKLYFASPEKPENASKLYYVEDLVNCLKKTFMNVRSDSDQQSIDESMVKFKGRSSMKQYQPLKPIKRGIKVWVRSDSKTGYVYDFDVYTGKGESRVGGLGERVVKQLLSTIQKPSTKVSIDRFFTSVQLLTTSSHRLVGTYLQNRKEIPLFPNSKMVRGESLFSMSNRGLIACKWMDSKEVFVMSNFHSAAVGNTLRKMKDGSRKEFTCPEMICYYNETMGGVDLSDQKVMIYDYNRRSKKWWIKVFQRLLMFAVINGWVVHQELAGRKTKLKEFIIPLADQLIKFGKQRTFSPKRRIAGLPGPHSKRAKAMINVGDHMPIRIDTSRRCRSCSQRKKETRTNTLCNSCNVPLCKNCFLPYHT